MEPVPVRMELYSREGRMTYTYVLPLASAVVAGAGILLHLIYLTSEYHESARPRRKPRLSEASRSGKGGVQD